MHEYMDNTGGNGSILSLQARSSAGMQIFLPSWKKCKPVVVEKFAISGSTLS